MYCNYKYIITNYKRKSRLVLKIGIVFLSVDVEKIREFLSFREAIIFNVSDTRRIILSDCYRDIAQIYDTIAHPH